MLAQVVFMKYVELDKNAFLLIDYVQLPGIVLYQIRLII